MLAVVGRPQRFVERRGLRGDAGAAGSERHASDRRAFGGESRVEDADFALAESGGVVAWNGDNPVVDRITETERALCARLTGSPGTLTVEMIAAARRHRVHLLLADSLSTGER